MHSHLPSPRVIFLIAAAFAAALVGYAYFAEFVQGYEPCPLCIVQRVIMVATGGVLLLAACHGPAAIGRAVYGSIAALVAAAGALVAGRHVWLQNLPGDQLPDCGPGLEYMFEVFPFLEAVRMVLSGSGECAEIDWMLFGLSMPGWVLICFVVLGVTAVWNGFRTWD